MPVTLEDVREFALPLPRTYERPIRDRVKCTVGHYVDDACRMVVPKRLAAETLGPL